MYHVVEIDKSTPMSLFFTPHAPFIYKSTITAGEASGLQIADYWTDIFEADGTYNSVMRNVTSMVYDTVNVLDKVDSLEDLTPDTFYFDYVSQTIYVHLPHYTTPPTASFALGLLYGFSDDTVRYFRRQLYQPIVKSIPTLSDRTDPLQYGIISFFGGTVVLENDGQFDGDEKLYGNIIRIKRGKEGDRYEQLTTIFEGYIKDYTTTTRELIIDLADKRERLQLEYPTAVFTDADVNVNGIVIPDGYGFIKEARGYLIGISGSSYTFRWAVTAHSVSSVFVKIDDSLMSVSFTTGDGTVTLAKADVAPSTSVREVYVTGVMRNISNPADIIVDLNERLLDVPYNSSNYDIDEWEAEKAYLADVGLYMDKARPLYEWIGELQNGSTWGFRYEDTGLRTIRRDDPDRPLSASIPAIAIRNPDLPLKRNADFYASNIIVKWDKSQRDGIFKQVRVDEYEEEVVDAHLVKKEQTFESLLGNTMGMVYDPVVGDGLVAWYPLNENANDYSGNGNHGTVSGATLTSGLNGGAYDFDGNDVITLNKAISNNMPSSVTFSAWVKAGMTQSGFYKIMGAGDEYGGSVTLFLGFYNNTIMTEVRKGGVRSMTTKPAPAGNSWHMLTGVFTSTQAGLFIDGVGSMTNSSGAIDNVDSILEIGLGRLNKTLRLIQDVRIYNRALTPAEISTLYSLQGQTYFPAEVSGELEATEKANRIAEDITEIRPILTVRYPHEFYPIPRIYDMVEVQASLVLGQVPTFYKVCYILGDSEGILGDDMLFGYFTGKYAKVVEKQDRIREYAGLVRGQVIGIDWQHDGDIEIQMRIR